MKQSVIAFNAEGATPIRSARSESTTVVAMDRQEDQGIVLRFLSGGPGGQMVKQVCLDIELASQLQRMLADELSEAPIALAV